MTTTFDTSLMANKRPSWREVRFPADPDNAELLAKRSMLVQPEQFDRVARDIERLPGGHDMCARIARSLSIDPETRNQLDNHWIEIGTTVTYCAGFPARAFALLTETEEFDGRWPLTFACWYWLASGASVDSACVKFIQSQNLVEPAMLVLNEYRDEFASEWREGFIPQLTSDAI